MEKIHVEVTGASGVFKVPLTSFVYKGDWRQEEVPKKADKSSGFGTVLLLLGLTVVAVVGYFFARKYYFLRGTAGAHELDSLDKTEYTMVSNRGDKSRNSEADEDDAILKKRR